MNIIFFNPNRIDTVFLAAMAFRKKGSGTDIIPVTPSMMRNWTEKINGQVAAMKEEEEREENLEGLEEELIKRERMVELDKISLEINSQKNEFFLLGLGPDNPEEADDLLSFFAEHKDEIVFWVDDHKWPEATVKYINEERKILFTEENPTLSEKYIMPAGWQEARRAILNHDLTNRLARRCLTALGTTITVQKKLADEDDMLITFVFVSIMEELLQNEDNPDVTHWEELFYDLALVTEEAEKNISGDSQYFQRAKEMGRPIGYLKLNRVSELLDLEEIVKYGLRKFPWLFVIEYSHRSQEATHLIGASRRINVQRLLQKYSEEVTPEEIINFYKDLEEEVISTHEIMVEDFLAKITS
jgi:hypothetical protein